METISTEWIVIDGAPSSGKTTVLRTLHRKGWRIIPEVGRAYIEVELAKGRTLEEVRGKNDVFLQPALINLYLQQFQNLDPRERVVFDGALPHAQAYIDLYGISGMLDVLALSRPYRFKKVFLFDLLPLEEDHVRIENAAVAAFLDRRIEEIYRELGYEPVRVPVMSVEERVDFMVERLEKVPMAVSSRA